MKKYTYNDPSIYHYKGKNMATELTPKVVNILSTEDLLPVFQFSLKTLLVEHQAMAALFKNLNIGIKEFQAITPNLTDEQKEYIEAFLRDCSCVEEHLHPDLPTVCQNLLTRKQRNPQEAN